MPALLFHLSPELLERAMRATLANGPRRADDLPVTASYEGAGEVINGPMLPPLYAANGQGDLTLYYPPSVGKPFVAPAPPNNGLGNGGRFMIVNPGPMPGPPGPAEAMVGGQPALMNLLGEPPPQVGIPMAEAQPKAAALPGHLTDVQIRRVRVLRGDDVQDAVVQSLKQQGFETLSSRTAWALNGAPPLDLAQPQAVRYQLSAPVADVLLLVEGDVKFYDRAAIDPAQPFDSDNALDKAFRRVTFHSMAGGPLLFRAQVVPARYRLANAPFPHRKRQADVTSSSTLPRSQLGGDALALDLVLEPVLELLGNGRWRNPIATDGWNANNDNRAFLRWLASYLEATAPKYKPPTGQAAPDRPGFRYSYYLSSPLSPSTWPFNAGLTALLGKSRALMVGLDLEPAASQAAWQKSWGPFYTPDQVDWGWPPKNGQPADFGVRIEPGPILAALRASLAPNVGRVFRREVDLKLFKTMLTWTFSNPQVTWDANGLHVTLDLTANFLGLEIPGMVDFRTTFSVANGQQTTSTSYQVKILGLPLPNDWISGFVASLRFLGKSCIPDASTFRCDYGRAETDLPILGKIAVESAATSAAGLHLYGRLSTPNDPNLQAFGHLKIEKVVGFTRKKLGDRDLYLWSVATLALRNLVAELEVPPPVKRLLFNPLMQPLADLAPMSLSAVRIGPTPTESSAAAVEKNGGLGPPVELIDRPSDSPRNVRLDAVEPTSGGPAESG